MKNLVLSGHLAYDRIVNVNSDFRDLSKTQSPFDFSLLGRSQEVAFGGCVGNVAYGLHKSKFKFQILSVLGSIDGQAYLDHFFNLGIDTSLIQVIERSMTSTAYMFSDVEDNQMIFFVPMDIYEGHDFHPKYPDPNSIDYMFISADVIDVMNKNAEFCRNHNIPFAFDPGQQLNNYLNHSELFLEAIKCADILFVNELEYSFILNTLKISHTKLLNYVNYLIVTQSSNPVLIYSLSKDLYKAVNVDSQIGTPVDTTGAGDAFRAGFMDFYLNDKSIVDCVKNGNMLASKSVMHKHPQGYEF